MKSLIAACLAALLLSACSDSDAPSGDDPVTYMETSPLGYQAAPAVAIGEKGALAWYKALVSGSRLPDSQAPARIGWLQAAVKCSFPRPAGDEKLVQVQVNRSSLPTGIVALSAAQIHTLSETPAALDEQLADPVEARHRAGMKLVDVVVTDTNGPIYLVLAGGDDILWNIQQAPKVVISHVAVVAGENAGIANLDPAVPVSALTGKAAADCGVSAARLPNESWKIVATAAEGEIVEIDEVKLHTARYERYNTWFQATFGLESEPVTIGITHMSHAFIGPTPATLDARLPYRGIDGANVLMAPTGTVFYSHTPEDYAKSIKDLLSAKAT